MEFRNRRKGFWWWSWILLLVTAGAIFGGIKWGEKQWEAQPKEYTSSAKIKLPLRGSIITQGEGGSSEQSTKSSFNESQVFKDRYAVWQVVDKLKLNERWNCTIEEATKLIADNVKSNRLSSENTITINYTTTNKDEAAEITNELVEAGRDRHAQLSLQEKDTEISQLDESLQIYKDQVAESRNKVMAFFKENGIEINLDEDSDPDQYDSYRGMKNFDDVHFDWITSMNRYKNARTNQKKVRDYWSRPIRRPALVTPATSPVAPSGPDKDPYIREGLLLGIIGGLSIGLGLTFICWKLFSK